MAKLKWRDSEDIYQPTPLSISQFLRERESLINTINSSVEEISQKHTIEKMSVFVHQNAVKQLKKHLNQDQYNETGGVLVGQAYLCPETRAYYTEIIGSIAAPYTIGNRVHFKFTPECWTAIFKEQSQNFPETAVVGWYHSHPGHGIFLSGTDLNTQRLSFKQPWHIAVVYDPLRQEIGFFYGESGGKIEEIYFDKIINSQGQNSRQVQLPPLPPNPTPEKEEADEEQEVMSSENQQEKDLDNEEQIEERSDESQPVAKVKLQILGHTVFEWK